MSWLLLCVSGRTTALFKVWVSGGMVASWASLPLCPFHLPSQSDGHLAQQEIPPQVGWHGGWTSSTQKSPASECFCCLTLTAHVPMHAPACLHAQSCVYTYSRTHTRRYACTHTHMPTHARTVSGIISLLSVISWQWLLGWCFVLYCLGTITKSRLLKNLSVPVLLFSPTQ